MNAPPNTNSIPLDRRRAGLDYVLERVQISYPGQEIDLSNAGRLVEQVAEATVKDDTMSQLVYGLRLLDQREVLRLVAILEGDDARA